MGSFPPLNSTALLRAIIKQKRRRGELDQALALAKIGSDLAVSAQEKWTGGIDELSRKALARYLEQSPNDIEVRMALAGEVSADETTLQVRATPQRIPGLAHGELPENNAEPGAIARAIIATRSATPKFAPRFGRILAVAVIGAVSATYASVTYRDWVSTDLPLAAPVAKLQPPVAGDASAAATRAKDRQESHLGAAQSVDTGAISGSSSGGKALVLPAGAAPREPLPETVPRHPFVVRAVGDITLGTDYPSPRLPKQSDIDRLQMLSPQLLEADLVIGNLEGVLVDGGKATKDLTLPRRYAFRMPRRFAKILRTMGFDVLNLANNHSLDFGHDGLASTTSALLDAGLIPVGMKGDQRPTVTVRGNRVAFVSFSYLPQFEHLDDHEMVRTMVARARAEADVVIVNVHAGNEGERAAGIPSGPERYGDEDRGDLRRFAHVAVNAGASAIFGHGAHVLRPIETYRGVPIFYSLGNFIGYRAFATGGKLKTSIVAEVRFSADGRVTGIGVIPLAFDASGVPVPDYSPANVLGVETLVDRNVARPPVLELTDSLDRDSVGRGGG